MASVAASLTASAAAASLSAASVAAATAAASLSSVCTHGKLGLVHLADKLCCDPRCEVGDGCHSAKGFSGTRPQFYCCQTGIVKRRRKQLAPGAEVCRNASDTGCVLRNGTLDPLWEPADWKRGKMSWNP